MAEMERFERSQDFSRHLSGVLPCQLGDISKMAEGYGVEPYTVISRRSFQDCLTHSTVGPSLKLAGTLGFEPRISILETSCLPVSLHP